MATIVVSPFDVANFPEGGGHFWVYMQYVQGLSRLGCEVYWLEQFRRGKDPDRDARAMARFFERMEGWRVGSCSTRWATERTARSSTLESRGTRPRPCCGART